MEKPVLDKIMQIVRNSSTQVTIRISRLIALLSTNKSATSIGALAGLALALVFTWRYLKAPSRSRRRPAKRPGARSIDHSSQEDGDSISSSGISDQKSSLKKQNVSPKQLTLVQVVRQRLNGARKVTCNILGVVLEELSSIELQEHAIVRPSVVDVLFEIAKACDLYLVARVLDDESEERVLSALDAVGMFTTAGVNRHKVLFCSTEVGKSSFVRQLEPDWHIDTNAEIISQLARYIQYQLHISSAPSGHIASNVFSSDTLEHFFGCLEQT